MEVATRGGARKRAGRKEIPVYKKKIPVTVYIMQEEIILAGGIEATREAINWDWATRVGNIRKSKQA